MELLLSIFMTQDKGSEYGISIFKLILLRYKCILSLLINVKLLSNMLAITSNKWKSLKF